MTSSEDAFQQLARILASRDNNVLEIEILSPTLGLPLLQDGLAVGITKKALVQAFTVARQLFNNRVPDPRDAPACLAASEVILLFDCEHLTACNWRKRWMLASMAQRGAGADKAPAPIQILEAELRLMSSYQCSPLHRHTKSPTLWHHRLWVLQHLLPLHSCTPERLLELQRAELDVVLRAAELHPKNYYAFSYMRQLHMLLADVGVDKDQSSSVELARVMVGPVFDWCLSNPRDISGWAFGLYLLIHVPGQQIRVDTVDRVLRFARDVGWEGESLWTFVDQAVQQFQLDHVAEYLLQCPETSLAGIPAATQKMPWLTWLTRARAYWAVNGQNLTT
ncbi:Protein prenyltransferase [Penicillium alfredii]|uniref:Protein prenyltransferase n=1 Tax=Penicillium alfredii TaxID=1506179 RepID=A0A9W9JTY5_9EURO|nr:Protein prenyltransferase [Penicillium alfredii]KAJ5081466.1 Protein prenyltransferase [Penicillium alfredii]